MGTMSAEWWREYRRRNRERLSAQQAERRRERPRVRGDRSAEYARRNERRRHDHADPLAPVHAHLQRGVAISFWEDELRIDIEQERALAVLEGRCPDAAERAYRARETGWRAVTAPLLVA